MAITLTYRKIDNDYNLCINNDGDVKMYSIKQDQSVYDDAVELLEAIFDDEDFIADNSVDPAAYDELMDIVSRATRANNVVQELDADGRIKIENGHISFDGVYLSGALIDKIIDFQNRGVRELNSLVRFLERLMQNPSFRVHDQLFEFLERGKTAITADGHFLAYKYVRDDYRSVHDGKTLHEIGTYVSMPRHQVNDDPNQTCAEGLHCCSNEYLNGYNPGNRVLQIKVDPKDVVSVPVDYNASKMRVCRYFVAGELTQEQVEADILAQSPVMYDGDSASSSDDDDDDYYDIDDEF